MKALLMRHGRALLLTPWILLVGVMLAGSYYTFYVAAWHAWLQLAGLGLLLLCLLATWGRGGDPAPACGHDHGPDPAAKPGPSWPLLAVQWAPLFVFLAMGPTSLSLTSTGLGGQGAQAQASAPHAPVNPLATPLDDAPPRLVDGYRELTILELHKIYLETGGLPEKVQVVGRGYVLTPTELANLPQDQRANQVGAFLYRFVISCCTADARPASVVLRGRGEGLVATDNWYQARGRPLVLPGPSRSLAIELDELKEVPAPDPPYIVVAF